MRTLLGPPRSRAPRWESGQLHANVTFLLVLLVVLLLLLLLCLLLLAVLLYVSQVVPFLAKSSP